MTTLRYLLVLASVAGVAACDIVQGPSPLNDEPVIEAIDEWVFVDTRGNDLTTRAYIDLASGTTRDLAIQAHEPEGEALTLVVGPLPRGWSFDDATRVLRAAPDHRQRGLLFTLYIAAEDAHDPPAYDVRVLEFNVY